MNFKKPPSIITLFAAFILVLLLQQIRFSWEKTDLQEKHGKIQSEFEQLKIKIGNMEASLGQSFVNAQKIPRPLIFCGDTINMDNHFIRERVEREFYSLLGNQGQLQLYFKRTQKYFPLIEKHLKEAGMPDDIKYLAVHESALLPKIRSRSKAVGLWQFMYHTGRLYKLKIDRYIDERSDPEKSTRAAIRFLSDLYRKFEGWPLVMAGYNGGQGRIARSIKSQKSENLIDLSLPEETERYYFKILATKIILSQPEIFGFKFESDDYFDSFPTVQIDFKVTKNKMDLEEIAQLFNMRLVALKDYNPHLKNIYLPVGSYSLNVPDENYAIYLGNRESTKIIPTALTEISAISENTSSEGTMPALK